jgi:hypothetical protein
VLVALGSWGKLVPRGHAVEKEKLVYATLLISFTQPEYKAYSNLRLERSN